MRSTSPFYNLNLLVLVRGCCGNTALSCVCALAGAAAVLACTTAAPSWLRGCTVP